MPANKPSVSTNEPVTPKPAPVSPPPPTTHAEKPPVRTQTTVLTILLLIVIALAVGVIFYFDQLAALPFVQRWIQILPERSKPNIVLPATPPSPTPNPTPSYLPPGKQTYTIGQTPSTEVPKITSLTLDPINVKNGEQQTVDVAITSSSSVKSVNITLYADDKNKQRLTLTQHSINGDFSVWRGTWTVNASVWYRFVVMITATNAVGENIAYVAPRTVGPIKIADLE